MPCSNCSNWKSFNTNFGHCRKIISNDWVGIDYDFVRIDSRSKDRRKLQNYESVISVGDGSADSVALITGKDFSCILYKGN